jgi:hypothetical protein
MLQCSIKRTMTRTGVLQTLRRRLPFYGPGCHYYAHPLKSSIWSFSPERVHTRSMYHVAMRLGRSRTIVTLLEEPPIDSNIPERPLTVVLVQDNPLYGTVSTTQWRDQLRITATQEFGMSFASLDLGIPNSTDDMYGGLEELQNDLSQLMAPQVLIMARGPLVSWWSQLHLEDFSLAGLILVDPLVPVSQGVAFADKQQLLWNYVTDRVSKHGENPDYSRTIASLFFSCEELQNHRQLLLEPGTIPMMVISSHSLFDVAADRTAERHRLYSETDKDDDVLSRPGGVPTLTIPTRNDRDHQLPIAACFRQSIGPWIESRVF